MSQRTLIYIANARIPTEKANGLQIMKTCEAFAAAGLRVRLVVPKRRNTITQDPFAYYGVRPTFEIVRIPLIDFIAFGKLGYWLNQLQFSLMLRLRSYCYILERDAVYFGRDVVSLAWIAKTSRRCIYELHDYTETLRTYLRKHVHRFAGFVTTNQWKKDRIKEDVGVADRLVHVAPNGVDLTDFERPIDREAIRHELGCQEGEYLVLYVGRFYAWKGVQTLLRAAGQLPPMYRVVCIGGTKEEAKVLALDASLDLVTFVPNVPHAKVADYQRSADILVLPNSAQTEESRFSTSPIKTFEYMASGRPIVASDLPSIRELLSEEHATLIPPDQPALLAEAIQRQIQDEVTARARGERAQVLARSYTWDQRVRGILDWMNRLECS
jgi:glycosyltransferase involved in cell wall biosynthesis